MPASRENKDRQSKEEKPPYTNSLIRSSSPYLLQHAHNPVDWYPWSEEALRRAKAENKPLIISIGYAACHWCHVMEHESYSDAAVAGYMNKHFVSIKVDREERADIDQIYMSASMFLTGSGGWPLNAFALPDGRPFYVVTYLPQEQWLELLREIMKVYREQSGDVEEQAEALTRGIRGTDLVRKPADHTREILEDTYREFFPRMEPSVDSARGGLGGAPKFPMPNAWELVLQYHYLTGHEGALHALTNTLDRMAMGGIYDQLGGGFARYATDGNWRVPHFEKMLYDNGQLVSLYSHAYQVTRNPLYAGVAGSTLAFIQREMTDRSGGFYSSLNADSEGEEGKFYVWTENEIDRLLDREVAAVVKNYYQVTAAGNWEEHKNILYRNKEDEVFSREQGMSIETWYGILGKANAVMLAARNRRVRPSTDTKILTSWNAIMVKGFADAYLAFGKKTYLETALKAAGFLARELMEEGGRVWRNYMRGKASVSGLLDDYAFLSCAFITLYEVTFDRHWLAQAEKLVQFTLAHFYDAASGLFFYTSDESESLIARKKETEDNVLPSSNSVMAQVLYRLGVYFDRRSYREKSGEMLAQVREQISAAVPYFSNWALLAGLQKGSYEVAIMGKEALTKSREMQRIYLPTTLFMGGDKEDLPLLTGKSVAGQTLIYVCENSVCQLPVANPGEALAQIK